MKRLSLVYPVITYRSKLKRNLSFVATDEWIVGQLYSDVSNIKYLLASPEGNEEHQRFYDVSNLRPETVSVLSPFKSNSDKPLFEGDIISVTAFEYENQRKEFSTEDEEMRELISFGAENIADKKPTRHLEPPENTRILFSAAGIIRSYNGGFFFEYLDPTKSSLGCAAIPLYQFYAPNMEPLDNHIIELIGNIYDNPQLAQHVLYVSSTVPSEQ